MIGENANFHAAAGGLDELVDHEPAALIIGPDERLERDGRGGVADEVNAEQEGIVAAADDEDAIAGGGIGGLRGGGWRLREDGGKR